MLFFGGEPTLRKDLAELIGYASQNGLITLLFTNGLLLTDYNVKEFKRAKLNFTEIGVDSPYSEIHDRLRGVKGSFNVVCANIKNCLNNNLNFAIATYATNENIKNGDLNKLILWAKSVGASYVRVAGPIPAGKWLGMNKDIKLTKESIKELKKIIDGKFAFSDIIENYCIAKNKRLFYVSPYGEVQLCHYVPISFGNVREEPLDKILKKMWESPIYKLPRKPCLMRDGSFINNYLGNVNSEKNFPILIKNK